MLLDWTKIVECVNRICEAQEGIASLEFQENLILMTMLSIVFIVSAWNISEIFRSKSS